MNYVFWIILAYSLLRILYFLYKFLTIRYGYLINRKAKIKHYITNNSKEIVTGIGSQIFEVINNYMRSFNRLDKCQVFMTDTFIKEIYYASTKDKFKKEITINVMMKRVIDINKYEADLYGYEIDEFQLIDPNSAFVGIKRFFYERDVNRVKYFLLKENNVWKFHHITRSIKGAVYDKFYREGKVFYLVKKDDFVTIFAIDLSEDKIKTNDYVYVDGFLEAENTFEDEFYYNIHTITVIL